MPENHFLDANVIIGSLIPWDRQHNKSIPYFETQGMFRHTSTRVFDECNGVFDTSRREILKYLKAFYRKFNHHSDPLRLDNNIQIFTRGYTATLQDDRMQRIVNNFVQANVADLRNIALGGEQVYGEFKQHIIDAIKYALNELIRRCIDAEGAEVFRYDCCPTDHRTVYPTEFEGLSTSMNHNPDVNVVLDSFYIKENHLQSIVYFMTFDRVHIISNKDEIERILPGIIISRL